MAKRGSDQSTPGFDIHERPTSPRARGLAAAADIQSTARMPPFELESLVRNESGTRSVVTAEQIDRFIRDRVTLEHAGAERGTMPMADAPARPSLSERQTTPIAIIDGAQTTTQQFPIDVDLSRLSRRAARLDRRQLTILAAFAIAMLSALVGFIAGRASL